MQMMHRWVGGGGALGINCPPGEDEIIEGSGGVQVNDSVRHESNRFIVVRIEHWRNQQIA
jgi:hypothetical protein